MLLQTYLLIRRSSVSAMFPAITGVDLSLPKAATLAWVENILGVPYSFQANNGPDYIIPIPLDLPPTVPARWLSDVAILDPKCEWGNGTQKLLGVDPLLNQSVMSVVFEDQGMNLTLILGNGFCACLN